MHTMMWLWVVFAMLANSFRTTRSAGCLPEAAERYNKAATEAIEIPVHLAGISQPATIKAEANARVIKRMECDENSLTLTSFETSPLVVKVTNAEMTSACNNEAKVFGTSVKSRKLSFTSNAFVVKVTISAEHASLSVDYNQIVVMYGVMEQELKKCRTMQQKLEDALKKWFNKDPNPTFDFFAAQFGARLFPCHNDVKKEAAAWLQTKMVSKALFSEKELPPKLDKAMSVNGATVDASKWTIGCAPSGKIWLLTTSPNQLATVSLKFSLAKNAECITGFKATKGDYYEAAAKLRAIATYSDLPREFRVGDAGLTYKSAKFVEGTCSAIDDMVQEVNAILEWNIAEQLVASLSAEWSTKCLPVAGLSSLETRSVAAVSKLFEETFRVGDGTGQVKAFGKETLRVTCDAANGVKTVWPEKSEIRISAKATFSKSDCSQAVAAKLPQEATILIGYSETPAKLKPKSDVDFSKRHEVAESLSKRFGEITVKAADESQFPCKNSAKEATAMIFDAFAGHVLSALQENSPIQKIWSNDLKLPDFVLSLQWFQPALTSSRLSMQKELPVGPCGDNVTQKLAHLLSSTAAKSFEYETRWSRKDAKGTFVDVKLTKDAIVAKCQGLSLLKSITTKAPLTFKATGQLCSCCNSNCDPKSIVNLEKEETGNIKGTLTVDIDNDGSDVRVKFATSGWKSLSLEPSTYACPTDRTNYVDVEGNIGHLQNVYAGIVKDAMKKHLNLNCEYSYVVTNSASVVLMASLMNRQAY